MTTALVSDGSMMEGHRSDLVAGLVFPTRDWSAG
jgi:hypothetical protein